MPSFYSDAEVEVDVTEFLVACNSHEIKEVIEYLKDEGHISQKNRLNQNTSLNESDYLHNLSVLIGNYHNVTKEEEEVISKIAKRFKFRD
jgi:vacuolar-type H+-ATPase subunit I/STV1